MTDITLNRRNALQGLLAISAAGALAACGNKDVQTADVKPPEQTGFFSIDEMAMLVAIADTIIPTTDTPGAVAAGVPETLQELATEWADDNHRTYWREGLRAFDEVLPGFTTMAPENRETVLGDFDSQVFGGEVENQFYRDMKSTIARAYYMSELGASEELAYEAVPGEWKGCVPLADYPKAWAT
jgi:hypothetical protein